MSSDWSIRALSSSLTGTGRLAMAQRNDPVLRGNIADARLRADKAPRDRGDVDDHAVLLLAHDRQRRERAMECARQVRPDKILDAGRGEPLPTPIRNVGPRVVDQDV